MPDAPPVSTVLVRIGETVFNPFHITYARRSKKTVTLEFSDGKAQAYTGAEAEAVWRWLVENTSLIGSEADR